jgi:predicted cupin superfamily sugar epimerase
MRAHPEGGWYVETWRAPDGPTGERPVASTILYVLAAGERSHWHRVDAAEAWHWYAGGALMLRQNSGGETSSIRLGPDLAAGERPQAVVPAQAWQAAESLGDWTLCGCTVAPGFEFAAFELAPPGWTPP